MPQYGRSRVLTGSGLDSIVAQQSRRSLIKSVQAGTIALTASVTSNTLTITTVDPNNSILLNLGYSYSNNSNQADIEKLLLTFTSSTVITASRVTGNPAIPTASVMVLEFYPGVIKSVQRGSINLANVITNTTTITTVDTTKTTIFYLGCSSGTGTNPTTNDLISPKLVLTNATTVTASRGGGDANQFNVGYQVVEFY